MTVLTYERPLSPPPLSRRGRRRRDRAVAGDLAADVPSIDFAARVPWWRERWRNELVPNAAIIVAEQAGALAGFVTIDASGYLDQLVVAPDHWGSELASRLVDEAKRRSPADITLLVNKDNARAIRFYERNGFVHAGEDVNPTSGKPVLKMAWKG